MSNENLAVVLISGGMDSALCAAIAKSGGYEIAALHLNYGQRTEKREMQSFDYIARHYDAKRRLVVDVSHLAKIGGSSLTDPAIPVEKSGLGDGGIPSSYVPFRNGNILSIAASWAEVIEAKAIYIGAMQLDSSGYPDCRGEFFEAFQRAIDLGTRPETKIDIIAPIINYSKRDIVQKGLEMDLPFELTWSCYENDDEACGVCESCALRLRGFQAAGAEDPLAYSQRPKYI
ncbi:MAG: 7-cyano-7-deazaguanine synthase QueC [Candidatus Kapaibacterium sp.]